MIDVNLFEDPWFPATEADGELLLREFEKELHPEHKLHGFKYSLLARRYDQDDILIEIHNAPFTFAIVHLTWTAQTERPGYPSCSTYNSQEELVKQLEQDICELSEE